MIVDCAKRLYLGMVLSNVIPFSLVSILSNYLFIFILIVALISFI